MFREKFVLTFALALLILLTSFVVVMVISHGDWHFWLIRLWLRTLVITIGLDFGLVFYIGWDYLNPTETRLPVYLALAASLIVALLYKGITLMLGMF